VYPCSEKSVIFRGFKLERDPQGWSGAGRLATPKTRRDRPRRSDHASGRLRMRSPAPVLRQLSPCWGFESAIRADRLLMGDRRDGASPCAATTSCYPQLLAGASCGSTPLSTLTPAASAECLSVAPQDHARCRKRGSFGTSRACLRLRLRTHLSPSAPRSRTSRAL